ncbi:MULTISPECIES: M23 family metallopeptidase [Brevundimonas]|uniref:M23 family metallopeptidase n=1 Tax=Brevundimonas TaxID=41275 RepID=UPI000F03C570|nr:M23 family metallopeptidase [Brevundimonas lutea]
MAQFDPRRQPRRFSPQLLTLTAAVGVALVAGRFYEPVHATEVPPLTAAETAALEAQAFATAGAPAGLAQPEAIPVQVRSGETFEEAIQRAGVGEAEARAVARTLSNAFDVSSVRAGLKFETAVARPRTGRGDARLIGLTVRTSPVSQLTVSRSFDGALRLRSLEEKVTRETHVFAGPINGSLAASAQRLGATSRLTSQATRLFAHKIDFTRDLKAGDRMIFVADRAVTESGRTIETGDLLYAEIKGHVFYRFQPAGAREAQYFDAEGKNIRSGLMRSPVDGARRSSNYGMRRHPISGYRKMHQGIDFAASSGTPVYAASDGVVIEARRWGGYGNWVRVRHSNGLETGYAHLSRFARGLRAGQRVEQGQVIAYVGSTGASTGPHLHYEIWKNGQRINPAGVKITSGVELTGADLTAFKAEKARIDAMVARQQTVAEPTRTAAVGGLRTGRV